MVKPEWGTKRSCQRCGARFYDLRRDPIVCPKCGAQHEPDANPRPKGNPTTTAVTETAAPKPSEELDVAVGGAKEGDVKVKQAEGMVDIEEKEDKDGEDPIEDANELGEDDEVLADVADGSIDDEDVTG